jgi:hypothetical protein
MDHMGLINANLPIDQVDPERLKHVVECAAEFRRRMRWQKDHIAWCRERLHMPDIPGIGLPIWEKQDEVWRSVIEHRKTHCRSGHKTGKTLDAAIIALWFLDCWRPSRVVSTSASWPDVKMKLWGHIRDRYRSGGSWFGVPVSTTDLKITDRHYATGLSCDRPEAFAGHNEQFVLVIIDEASAVRQELWDAAEAEATKILEIGNPLLAEGPFYKHASSSEYNHIHISCWDHPNVKTGVEIIPGGPTLAWCQDRLENWGETDPLYRTRVLGEFPEESADSLFPMSLIQACFDRWKEVKDLEREQDAEHVRGLDVARAGGDRTEGYDKDRVKLGDLSIARYKKVLELRKTDHYRTRMRMAGIFAGDPCDITNVDAGGEGSGLADELANTTVEGFDKPMRVRRVHFGANATTSDYFNVRAEMYWQLSQAMKAGAALEPDEQLREELIVVGGMATYKEKQFEGVKKLVRFLRPKEEVKELLGRSCDKSDGLALANYKPGGLGLLDFYAQEAKRVRQQGAEQQPLDQSLAAAQMTAADDDRFAVKDKSGVAQKSRPAGKVCPDCGRSVAQYEETFKCFSCGRTGRNNELKSGGKNDGSTIGIQPH